MSQKTVCDICGNVMSTSYPDTSAKLTVYHLNDGLNTECYDVVLDICEVCLAQRFLINELAQKVW